MKTFHVFRISESGTKKKIVSIMADVYNGSGGNFVFSEEHRTTHMFSPDEVSYTDVATITGYDLLVIEGGSEAA